MALHQFTVVSVTLPVLQTRVAQGVSVYYTGFVDPHRYSTMPVDISSQAKRKRWVRENSENVTAARLVSPTRANEPHNLHLVTSLLYR